MNQMENKNINEDQILLTTILAVGQSHQPNNVFAIKFIITPDPHKTGHIFECPQEIWDHDILMNTDMDDNGIPIPQDLQSGLYSADLVISSSHNAYDNDYDINYKLENIQELIVNTHPIENDHQENKKLKAKIKELEPQAGYIFVEGNNGGNLLEITKLDDNKIHLKVGDCCVYIVDANLTAEAFSGFLSGLMIDENNRSLLEIIKSHLHWDENFNDKVMENCKDLQKKSKHSSF